MSRIAQQIEFGRTRGIGAGEDNFFVSAANIQSIELLNLKWDAAHSDYTRASDIQDAEFTPLGKIRCLQRVVGGQKQRPAGWYRRADHCAVKIDIGQSNRAGLKEIVNQKRLAQFFGGHRTIADRVGHLQYSHWP